MSVDRQLRAHRLCDDLTRIEGHDILSNDSISAITNALRDYAMARLHHINIRIGLETLDSVSKGKVLEILEAAIKDERQS